MPSKGTGIRVEGLRDLQRALRRLPPELESNLRDASTRIAEVAAKETAAAAQTRAERKAAASIRARRGRNPVIAAGGSGDDGKRMFLGTEFGGRGRPVTQQFRPHRGTEGYFFFPTVRDRGREWAEIWVEGVDDAIRKHWRNR